MKIEILYNFIPHGQIKKQNDVRIELGLNISSVRIKRIYYISFYDLWNMQFITTVALFFL